MPSPAPAAIRQLSRELHERLRKVDPTWKRGGVHLYRKSGEVFQALHFQASQFGSVGVGSFTINLIVTEPRIYRAWTERDLPGNPATAGYPVQLRIGRMLGIPRDHWWEVTSDTDFDELFQEVWNLTQKALDDFFPKFSSLATMLSFARNDGLPGLAGGQQGVTHGLLEALLGHEEKAREVFLSTIEKSRVPAFSANVHRAARNVGIEI